MVARLRRLRLPFAAVLAAGLASAAVRADDAGSASEDAARRARVAIRVGSRAVTVGEVEDRLAEIPPFQISTFGASRYEVVKAYVDQVIVRDLLLGAGAEQKKLDSSLPTKQLLQRARSTATLRALRTGDLRSPQTIPAEDVKKYYEDNRAHFDSPERVNLWRILCKSQDEANKVLAEAQKDLTIQKFNTLARDHSIDKATMYRGGNLGFLAPDGTSNEAGLKVDPAIVKAAGATRDGELVAQTVPEATGWAVIWRRTTVPPAHRSLEDATAQIRSTLYRERTEAQEKKLVAELRAKHVRDVNADALKIIELPVFDAGLSLPRSIPRLPDAGH